MKAVCPNNEDHDEFVTVVHVTEDWVVDSEGNWIETHGDEQRIFCGPDTGNTWSCHTCGAEAKVSE